MLYKYKDRSDGFLFIVGTVLGGAYEYFCSVFTEMIFGTVFWDYSKIPLILEAGLIYYTAFFGELQLWSGSNIFIRSFLK